MWQDAGVKQQQKKRAARSKSSTKKVAAKKPAAKKRAARNKSSTRKVAAKKVAAKKPAAKKPAPRADYGAPIDGFFSRQPPHLRAVLEDLRKLIEEEAPDAQSSLKWGMPFYTLDGATFCATSAHKSHVNLILSRAPDAFSDPTGRLSGEGKTGRHLKLTTLDELPRDAVRGWLRTAAEIARKK
jgi:hypothetical protein